MKWNEIKCNQSEWKSKRRCAQNSNALFKKNEEKRMCLCAFVSVFAHRFWFNEYRSIVPNGKHRHKQLTTEQTQVKWSEKWWRHGCWYGMCSYIDDTMHAIYYILKPSSYLSLSLSHTLCRYHSCWAKTTGNSF